jgi:RNA polymerase sigma-70 factor (ECF subfamily)
MESTEQVTQLLSNWRNGDRTAFDSLFSLVYEELRAMASSYMRRERPDHTLQTTALVNEAYIKLLGQSDALWENRVYFFAIAAKVMRQILIDYARTRRYAKRGGGVVKLTLDETATLSDQRAGELVALDEALQRLEEIDPRKSQVVELRFFGGLTIDETAGFLNVSRNTVTRDWEMARAWLYQQVSAQ